MTKKPWQSKTINGAFANLLGVAVLCAAFFGFDVDGDTVGELENHVDDIMVAGVAIWKSIASIVVIWGRVTAKKDISFQDDIDTRLKNMSLIALFLMFPVAAGASDNVVVDFSNVTSPVTIQLDWNNPNVRFNHPMEDRVVAAPDLANDYFEELKIVLEIKGSAATAREILDEILVRKHLRKVIIDPTE